MSLNTNTQQHVNDCNKQLQVLKTSQGLLPFQHKLEECGLFPLISEGIRVMQVNLGKVCNQLCKHCHVQAGPERTESMNRKTAASCLSVMAASDIAVLDITGGAPELNPNLTFLVEEAAKLGKKIIVRTNLTALERDEYAHLAELYTRHNVEVFASLPYYRGKDSDRQRGDGVFESSIKMLRRLNKLGYGHSQSRLQLNLVYNPGGAFLPPAQHSIESVFKRELLQRYGIVFNKLYAITNVPIGRFLDFLIQSGNLDNYMHRLAAAFNSATVKMTMCRSQISVGWDGSLYDCDFNQMLGLYCAPEESRHIDNFDLTVLKNRRIILDNHCYACTAGAGSSCTGAVLADVTRERAV